MTGKATKTAIKMQECKSTNVAAHGYDDATKTLAIKFGNGATYHYANVPKEVHAKLCGCESIGKFVGAHLRGKYPATRQ